ncbi:MAG: hypothetical protein JW943_10030 [Deltaproteobacteria bacterium]|nr:hypothetical protein [Deltaproteobacteria bacterium]
MVSIDVKGNAVTISVLGSHKLWAFKRRISFNKEAISWFGKVDPNLRPPWLRCPGTHIPKIIAAGTYYGRGRKEFWDTTFKGKAIQFDLKSNRYTRIVVDTEDLDTAIHALSS